MVRLIFAIALFFGFCAHAQEQPIPSAWLNLEYTYDNFYYSEAAMNEKGNFPGVRGQLGVSLFGNFGVSVGGEYMDGNLNYDGATFGGTPVKTVTKDYIRDLRTMVHLFMGPMSLAGGFAEREWYNNLVISYRRRETYKYVPIEVTLHREAMYLRVEYDLQAKGKNTSYMSDVNPAEKDVTFTQNSGSGYGVEVGYEFPTMAGFRARGFLEYHKWSWNESDIQNDGVYNLQEPKNTTTVISGGLGIGF